MYKYRQPTVHRVRRLRVPPCSMTPRHVGSHTPSSEGMQLNRVILSLSNLIVVKQVNFPSWTHVTVPLKTNPLFKVSPPPPPPPKKIQKLVYNFQPYSGPVFGGGVAIVWWWKQSWTVSWNWHKRVTLFHCARVIIFTATVSTVSKMCRIYNYRKTYFNVDSLKVLLEEIYSDIIFNYLKEINIFCISYQFLIRNIYIWF